MIQRIIYKEAYNDSILFLQVAHRSRQQEALVNLMERFNRPKSNLEDNGLVHTTRSDLTPRTDNHNLKKSHPKDANSTASRTILRNVAKEQAFQINGPIGERGWREVTQLEICDNEATGSSIQINHAVSEEVFLQLLAQKDRSKIKA
ncbi:hypothetical protein EYC80_007427 [Monilinia laxa]|uniref:Uncharacterized protein n=1 Tax=Monilinia laxa TaxID=61186 RepID=A0A5N6JUP0_MONLA|nr:hypothetical protein EYC80_007427 [Monilinia laxa]